MDKKIISIINQKGGVGKTTTVINLAAGLSMKGKKILVIDLDPQGNATTGLGLSNTASSDSTIYSVLNGNKKITEVIQQTSFENLNLVTSNVDLSGLEVETAGDSRRAFKLKDELTSILNDSRASYDYILIDCPPSLSLLTIMALVASDALVVPLQTEFFALEGLTQLMKTIEIYDDYDFICLQEVKEKLEPIQKMRYDYCDYKQYSLMTYWNKLKYKLVKSETVPLLGRDGVERPMKLFVFTDLYDLTILLIHLHMPHHKTHTEIVNTLFWIVFTFSLVK